MALAQTTAVTPKSLLNKENVIVMLAVAAEVAAVEECGGCTNAQVRIWGCAAMVCSFLPAEINTH
jgi:hypothetical protein